MNLNKLIVMGFWLAGLFTITAAVYTVKFAMGRQNKQLYVASLNWFCWGVAWFLYGVAHLTGIHAYHLTSAVLQAIGVYALLIVIEFNSKLYVSSFKVAVYTIINTLFVYFNLTLRPNYIEGYGFNWWGPARVFQIILALGYSYLTLNWVFHVFKHHPTSLNKNSKKLMYSGMVMGPLPIFIYFLGTYIQWLNSLPFLIYGLGILYFVLVINKEPTLLYILPFQAHKFLIIDKKTNKNIYEHNWTKKEFDQNLLSLILSGVAQISDNVLLGGKIDNLVLKNAAVIFVHDNEYLIVLIANKNSGELNSCVKSFSKEFKKKKNILKRDLNGNLEDQSINVVNSLINSHFANIASWI